MRNGKYNNTIVYEDNLCFRSILERARYRELKLLLQAGQIFDLRVHTRWKLIVAGILIAVYEDDFNYQDTSGLVVEDVKSEATITDLYIVKRNLMKVCYGIEVMEVRA